MNNCRFIKLPRKHDPRGDLTIIEGDTIPFDIKRVYYLSHVPDGETRAGHAHRTLEQVIIAVSGGLRLRLDNGQDKQKIILLSNDHGVYIPPGVWRELDAFTSGAVCLVLASAEYDETDYIRDYVSYKEWCDGRSLPGLPGAV